MKRPAGPALVVAGCFVLIVELRVLDRVIASVSWNRGVHVSDLLGLLLVSAGIAVIWRA